jgi:hypothetical protein
MDGVSLENSVLFEGQWQLARTPKRLARRPQGVLPPPRRVLSTCGPELGAWQQPLHQIVAIPDNKPALAAT